MFDTPKSDTGSIMPVMPPSPTPAQSPNAKPKKKPMQPSFLGADAVPAGMNAAASKTLLGQ